jgi:hypothetical protein
LSEWSAAFGRGAEHAPKFWELRRNDFTFSATPSRSHCAPDAPRRLVQGYFARSLTAAAQPKEFTAATLSRGEDENQTAELPEDAEARWLRAGAGRKPSRCADKRLFLNLAFFGGQPFFRKLPSERQQRSYCVIFRKLRIDSLVYMNP